MLDNSMIPDNGSQATDSETPDAGTDNSTVDNDSANPQDFDFEKSDNVSQIRTYAKGLKGDLDTYKPSHEFITSKFGDVKNAEVAHSLYQTFASEEFDPENFSKILSQLSPQRTDKLFETKASALAEGIAQKKIKELFGSDVKPDEVARYKQWVESGYGLGEGDDIPDALKFDAAGNPKSDEEIQFLRDLQKATKQRNADDAAKKAQEEADLEEKRVFERNTRVSEFSNARLNVLNKELDILGLKDLPTDTAAEKESKATLRNFFLNGVSGIYLSNPEMAKDFHSAMGHLEDNEVLLARKYEASIEKNLLDILRSDALKSVFNALANPDKIHDDRPEISNSESSSTPKDGGDKPKNESVDEFYARLVSEGKIKP